jgi:hypothetical protein
MASQRSSIANALPGALLALLCALMFAVVLVLLGSPR